MKKRVKRKFRLSPFTKSFRVRLYLIFTGTIALLTAAFVTFYVLTEINAYRSTLEREGRLLATILSQNARLPLFAENREALSALAEGTSRQSSVVSVLIIDQQGRVAAEARKVEIPQGETVKMEVEITSPSSVLSPESVLLGHQETDKQRVIGRVHLLLDMSAVRERLVNLVAASLAIGTLFWVAVSLLSYQVLKRVTSSFNMLMGGIEEIGSGKLSARVDLEGDDELARAANAINAMAASLELRELENLALQEELLKAMKLEVQEEKKLVMARLIQTNKMTSLGLLLSSMAHEINNPNASIRFSGYMIGKVWSDAVPLLDRVREEEGDFYLGGVPFEKARHAMTDNAGKIVENSERIARVVQGLRDYGVGGDAHLHQKLELNAAVSAALSVLACQIKKDVQLKTSLGTGIPVIPGSQSQIEQVLINLILNAMQALDDGEGEVHLTTRHDADNGEVVVEVSDNGVGIKPETMERLFEPFYSTKLDRGGSGLGLYISQYIVVEHGGRLQLTSAPGKGTMARVVLPTAHAASVRGMVSAQDGQHAADALHQVG
ncbi:LOW QUALITY PROTEIN: sensor histidine kinase [Citrifermentans bemidjiense Bem]|uniref:histidine kinase n=2 Tax=Citrifermentans bemidjiense TaxID=225194 RepID=E1P6B4_CITBB|nr:LOW QUALITY PROTEIN: sensor histidine kinase [Citrifermentans bemidjiense Bem]